MEQQCFRALLLLFNGATAQMKGPFPQYKELERLTQGFRSYGRVNVETTVSYGGESFPLYSIVLGSSEPEAPVLGLVGGVHGLEKIGSEIVLAYLEQLLQRLEWDDGLHWQLQRMRLILMPIVNPVGMRNHMRCNGNFVDLMRNSPSVAEEGATPLVGGHRLSRMLPWHMGTLGKMEAESQAVCDFIRRESFQSSQTILVDVHSGFGLRDQIWFPYARSRQPFPSLPEVAALKSLIDRVLPNHVYKIEPQALIYTTHGDLWDHLYDEHRACSGLTSGDPGVAGSEKVFLPLTLELGSWRWVRKNPLQIFSRQGAFNPMKPHRQKRAMRRHMPLFDFLMRAVISPRLWKVGNTAARELFLQQGLSQWYGLPAPARPAVEPVS